MKFLARLFKRTQPPAPSTRSAALAALSKAINDALDNRAIHNRDVADFLQSKANMILFSLVRVV